MDVPVTQRIIKSSVLDAIKQKGRSGGTWLLLFINTQRRQAASYHSVSAHCRLLAVWSACETLALPPSCLHLEEAGSLGQGRGGRGLGYVERCQSLPLLPGLQFRFQRLRLKCHEAEALVTSQLRLWKTKPLGLAP